MDENGDAEGNYSVLAHLLNSGHENNHTMPASMEPIARFVFSNGNPDILPVSL